MNKIFVSNILSRRILPPGAGNIFNVFGRKLPDNSRGDLFSDVLALKSDWEIIGSELKRLISCGK